MKWPTYTVSELEESGDLLVQDGNHGEQRPRPNEFVENGVPFVRAGDLKEGRVNFQSAERINETAFRRIRKGIARPGDIILASKGTVGVIALAGNDYDIFVCSPQTTFWRVLEGAQRLERRFLHCFLRSSEFHAQVNALKGQTDMAPYLSLTEQRKMAVRVPPIRLQRRIGDIIGTLDHKIDCNRRINDLLLKMARALYQHLFVDGGDAANPQRLTDLVEVAPLVRVQKGKEVPYVDMRALPTDGMSVSEVARRPAGSGSKFQNGDTLFARITPCLENGKTAFVDFLDDDEAGVGSTEFIVMRAKPGVSPQFVLCCARDPELRAHAIKSMVGSSGRQRVRSDCLEHFHVKRFSPRTMPRFHETTLPWFQQIRANVKENQVLAQTRDYLLPKLLSGEVEATQVETQA
jgi:type I restriction enzyme, S subunit